MDWRGAWGKMRAEKLSQYVLVRYHLVTLNVSMNVCNEMMA